MSLFTAFRQPIIAATVAAVGTLGVTTGISVAAVSGHHPGHIRFTHTKPFPVKADKPGRPVREVAPESPPPASESNGQCSVDYKIPSSNRTPRGLVNVHANPTGITLLWLPGINATDCESLITNSASSRADRLARDVRHAPSVPRGIFACPASDGTGVEMFFQYAHGQSEYVDVPLSGCAFLNAPGRDGRQETAPLRRLLHRIAPHAWRSDLRYS